MIKNISLLIYLSIFIFTAGIVQAEPYGLNERAQNLSCVAPARPSSNVTTQRVFANLSFDAMISMSQPPSDPSRWFIAELTGVIHSFSNIDSISVKNTILDISDRLQYTAPTDSQQAGLTSFAIHPDFPNTPYIYIAYNAKPGSTDNVLSTVSRITSKDGGLTFDESTEQILLSVEQLSPWHHVGQVTFGLDGYLYIGLGDSGGKSENQSQNLNDLRGSILRVDVDNGTPYSIPTDNPLVGTGFREEIFSWGVRNPWRFNVDMLTGEIWAGDVGESKWEEINKIESGSNYGWGNYEGPDCRLTNCDSTGLTPPILAFDHTQITSIIGGYVYRGDAIPSLQGAFLFGDSSGVTMRTLMYDNDGQPYSQGLFESPVKVHSFAQDLDGELYLIRSWGSKLYKIVPNSSSPGSVFPQLLSETGCVEPSDPSQPSSGVVPINVNTKLWSDGADKKRWIAIPDGETIELASDGDFDFPIGTVLVKQFLFDTNPFETRLFVRHDDGGWAGYSYEWLDDLSDAVLLPAAKTKLLPNGVQWSYPSRDQCLSCHTDIAGGALGPEILQLNGDMLYPSSGIVANQLRTLEHIGMFTSGLPQRVADLSALSPIDDSSASITQRARSYLHSNCSGCHRPGSPVTANIDLRYQTQIEDMNICNVAPDHGDIGVPGAMLLMPGNPSSSVLSLRVHSQDENRMPPLSTAIVDIPGTNLLDSWISLTDVCDPVMSNSTLYEDASDGAISGWSVYDDQPPGSSISNVFDTELQSNVIKLSGSGDSNGYWLKNDDLSLWENNTKFILQVKLKFSEYFVIYIDVETTDGHRYLKYTPVNTDLLGSGEYVHHGMGVAARDGNWRAITRNLQEDLSDAQPGNTIVAVNSLMVRGSGNIDAINLLQQATDADTDEDGISDIDETNVYLTDPTMFDTDADGVPDGVELIYWAGDWGEDNDDDSLYNILDPDSDNDGALDGEEIAVGSDPAIAELSPSPTVYEDAENGDTTGWLIYDDNPTGAMINNVFDQQRQSRAIEFTGAGNSNGYILWNNQLESWDNSSQFIFRWSMKFDGYYTITVKVRTTDGFRYLSYNPKDTDDLSTGSTITHGIGFNTRDNHWRTVTRDLQLDLEEAQLGNLILEVHALIVRGNGRMDDIGLYSQMPAEDTDLDGIADTDEVNIYGTNPSVFDTDLDGLPDGIELAYWSTNWNQDFDGDGQHNLIDPDTDNDGISDGDEIDASTDPSGPARVYEDAADGATSGWDIYDNTPVGSIISNVYDTERQSRVIELTGSGYSNGFRLRNDDSSLWKNTTDFVIEWSMKTGEYYSINIEVMTSYGFRYLRYKPEDTDALGSGTMVDYGLGSDTKDNQWRRFTRDLQRDLEEAQPGNTILEVNAFLLRGSSRIDDIKLSP